MKIIIDPRSNYSYSSFYIKELMDLCGKCNMCYSLKPFSKLDDIDNDMRFVVDYEQEYKKVFLHLNDMSTLKEKDYDWCDIYGSVNANFQRYPKENYPKLISLAPSFGIRNDNLLKTLWSTLQVFFINSLQILKHKEWNKNTSRMECNPFSNIKHHFGRRYKTWKYRLPLSAYKNIIPSTDNYVFFLSTLWYSDEWNKNDETVNLRRAHFIRACRSINQSINQSIPQLNPIKFEGGLLADKSSSNEKFADVLAEHGEPFTIWIEKTKRSALVFNTPAFWDCHGWKLGEYLALGKCIISTKLNNDLPCPLEHGKNIHFVEDNEESMREAIEYILAHPDYRHKLEQGAKEYWEKYGTPEASLRLLGIKASE